MVNTVSGVVTERGEIYGNPYDNFGNIARLWSVYLNEIQGVPPGFEIVLSRSDIGFMMILLKVARAMYGAQDEDTVTDIAGYAKCIELIRERESVPISDNY